MAKVMTMTTAATWMVVLAVLVAGCGVANEVAGSLAPSPTSASLPVATPPAIASTVTPHSATPSAALAGGDWLLYQQVTGAGGGVFLMRPDGSGAHPLAADVPGVHVHPDWSPDGARIVFVVEDPNALWLVNADGRDAHRILECSDYCDYPAWAPDGQRIAFSRARSGTAPGPSSVAIEILDLSSGTVTQVAIGERPILYDVPRWSPDGTQLAVGVDRMDAQAFETGATIAIVDTAGGTPRRLLPFDAFAYEPDWSATGTLVYARDILGAKAALGPEDRTWDLFTLQPDGSGVRQLTRLRDGDGLRHPTFSSDGGRIYAAFVDPEIAVAVDAATGAVTTIGGDLVAHPKPRP